MNPSIILMVLNTHSFELISLLIAFVYLFTSPNLTSNPKLFNNSKGPSNYHIILQSKPV